jgi:hypothetical protein
MSDYVFSTVNVHNHVDPDQQNRNWFRKHFRQENAAQRLNLYLVPISALLNDLSFFLPKCCSALSAEVKDKKRSPNRLIVDEASNDDNSVLERLFEFDM